MSDGEDDQDKKSEFEKTLKDGRLTESSKKLLAGLTAREAKVLRMKFGINLNTDHTLEEVAKQFDVTRQRIREIEAKALKKLRGKNNDDDPDDDGPDAA